MKVFRKRWLRLNHGSLRQAAEVLQQGFKSVHPEARAEKVGDGLSVYLEPLLQGGRIRLTYTPRGGLKSCGRWDLWDPRQHRRYLAGRGYMRRDVKLFKLKGLIIRPEGLFELEAFNWDVFSRSDLILKSGTKIELTS